MTNKKNANRLALAVLAVTAGVSDVFAHGPVIVLTNNNGTIQTNQLDVTPTYVSPSDTSDYLVGSAARNFPSAYNTTVYDSWNATASQSSSNSSLVSAWEANKPATSSLGAFPMTLVSASSAQASNSGFYDQLEATDAEGNSTLNTGPGFAYGNGNFAAGTIFQISFASKLQYWNGSSFGPTPDGEQLQFIRSTNPAGTYGNAVSSNGAVLGVGAQVAVSSSQNAGSHSQGSYRLLDASGSSTDLAPGNPGNDTGIDNGLYLATLQVAVASNSSSGYAQSLPFYVLFNLSDSSSDDQIVTSSGNTLTFDRSSQLSLIPTASDIANADAYINNVLIPSTVPEPTSLALLAIAGSALLRRRRAIA